MVKPLPLIIVPDGVGLGQVVSLSCPGMGMVKPPAILFLSHSNSPYKPPVKQLMMQLEMGQFVSFRRSHVIARKAKPKKLPVAFQWASKNIAANISR